MLTHFNRDIYSLAEEPYLFAQVRDEAALSLVADHPGEVVQRLLPVLRLQRRQRPVQVDLVRLPDRGQLVQPREPLRLEGLREARKVLPGKWFSRKTDETLIGLHPDTHSLIYKGQLIYWL